MFEKNLTTLKTKTSRNLLKRVVSRKIVMLSATAKRKRNKRRVPSVEHVKAKKCQKKIEFCLEPKNF